MGLGLQIACQGFADSSDVEREAGVELVRLERAARDIADCRLTIDSFHDEAGRRLFGARLVLVTRDLRLIAVERSMDADLSAAIHRTFENAMRVLAAAHGAEKSG